MPKSNTSIFKDRWNIIDMFIKFTRRIRSNLRLICGFCILCGCDYTTRIKNIGPTRAYQYIKTYKNIDNLL